VPGASLAELRALDVGAWKGERWRGERIPLLEEVLDALPGAVVNVELKSRLDRDLRVAGAVARLLARRRDADRVIVSSFDYRLLVAFRLAAPAVPVGLLFEAGHRWWLRTALAIRLLRPAAVHPDRRLATAERVRSWLGRGLGVNVWTVDAPEEVERLCGLGATAVISNTPGATRDLVRRFTGR
jgi:glycerophosphoryl diester phosphodiesterase